MNVILRLKVPCCHTLSHYTFAIKSPILAGWLVWCYNWSTTVILTCLDLAHVRHWPHKKCTPTFSSLTKWSIVFLLPFKTTRHLKLKSKTLLLFPAQWIILWPPHSHQATLCRFPLVWEGYEVQKKPFTVFALSLRDFAGEMMIQN